MADLAAAEGPLLGQILDASYPLWHEGLSRRAYERYYAAQVATPWGRQHLRRFALVEGTEVVSSAKEYTFAATLDKEPIRATGIGGVFTQPAHRGRGHAAAVIERLLDRAAGRRDDLALLFSEIGTDYYARLGFEPIPTADVALRVAESTRRGAPATLVRFAEDRDLADIVATGESRAAPFRFHLNRDRDLVHYAISRKRVMAGLSPPGAREVQFFIAEEGASAVAYVVITARRGADARTESILEECGDRDPAGARVGAILQALIARDPAEIRPSIRTRLPAGFCPPQITLFDERPCAQVMMVRPLSDRARAALPLRGEDVLFWHGDRF